MWGQVCMDCDVLQGLVSAVVGAVRVKHVAQRAAVEEHTGVLG